jgi:hypothetical protein
LRQYGLGAQINEKTRIQNNPDRLIAYGTDYIKGVHISHRDVLYPPKVVDELPGDGLTFRYIAKTGGVRYDSVCVKIARKIDRVQPGELTLKIPDFIAADYYAVKMQSRKLFAIKNSFRQSQLFVSFLKLSDFTKIPNAKQRAFELDKTLILSFRKTSVFVIYNMAVKAVLQQKTLQAIDLKKSAVVKSIVES